MIKLTELTIEERAVHGTCPVCMAEHGRLCRVPIKTWEECEFSGTHIARLVNAPLIAAIEELGAQHGS